MAQRYWIGVVHKAQADAARRGGLAAFSHGKEAPVRKLSPGDGFILYAPKSDSEGAPLQRFVALGRVDEGPVAERGMPGTSFRPWSRPATYAEVVEVPVRPMLESLTFVRSPRHWGMAFRRSLFEIEAVDFDWITRALRGVT
ncbi:MAG: EVE domain-containing protein [Pseudomonadota bacterium]